jgi:hypothetical protein
VFGLILAILGFVILYLVTTRERGEAPLVAWSLQGAYALRLVLQLFLRDIPFFSGGNGGGDALGYEQTGWWFAQLWAHTGIHYVTKAEIPELGDVALPGNIFGLVIYFNGDFTRLGCTALVALSACLTAFNLYRLSVELGARKEFASRVLLLTLFGPAFLMYTSDTYKDAFVMLFTTGVVASAFRLARNLSVVHMILGAISLVGLWQVRHYMVFLAAAPVVIGFIGLTSRSLLRPLGASLVLGAVLLGLLTYSGVVQEAQERAQSTFTVATSLNVRGANAEGGSGVTFDDGGKPLGAIGPKIAYTLFAPFPWQAGSIGFQIGKLDVFVWYFLAYRAFLAARALLRERPALLFMFLIFLLPATLAYAMTMANIGLIVRQRLPIILIASVLACLSEREEPESEEAEDEDLLVASGGTSSPRAR